MPNRKSFILYQSFEKQFNYLSLEDRGILISAVFDYAIRGNEYCGDNTAILMAFSFIKEAIDRDGDAYDKRCVQNKENGKKGGRPRKNDSIEETAEKTERFSEKPKKTEWFFQKPKKPDNDNDNENDNENDNGNENESPLRSAPPPPRSPSALSMEERNFLAEKGVTDEYVNARLERAVESAVKRRRSVAQVLLEWWNEDAESRSKPKIRAETEQERQAREAQEWFDTIIARDFGL